MIILAATTLEKLQKVPLAFWLNVIMGLVILVAVVLVIRKAATMSRWTLAGIAFMLVFVVGFNWVYERNEPKFLTPFINKIAPYFPAKTTYKN